MLKFRKHESFYIRDGWIEKAINAINDNASTNIFAKNNGISILGIGSNMVKSLKYWLQASNIIKNTHNSVVLTEFGNLLLRYDKYIESNFSLFLIHYFLVSSLEENPVANILFNSSITKFTKSDALQEITKVLNLSGESYKTEYVDTDLTIFLKSYYEENVIENPEDNYACPLSQLNLLTTKMKKYYKKNKPHYRDLSYLIIYFSLANLYDYSAFNIEDSYDKNNSPFLLFNLDKNMYWQYLDEMKKNDLITINRTAGLNTVYFEKKLTLEEIFEVYFGGGQNV